MPVSYDTMFIWLCSTSKCNYLTYNTRLYTREMEEKKREDARRYDREEIIYPRREEKDNQYRWDQSISMKCIYVKYIFRGRKETDIKVICKYIIRISSTVKKDIRWLMYLLFNVVQCNEILGVISSGLVFIIL